MPAESPVLASLPDYPVERLNAAKAELRAAGRDVYDFGTGDPLEPTPAFVRKALRGGLPEVCRYPPVRGLREHREAAAAYLKRRFGVAVDPDREVLPTRGSKEAIFHLPFAFLDPKGTRDTVVHPTPGYTVYGSGARFAGGRAHGVPLVPANAFLLRPADLPAEVRARTAILWTNYPHNPSGALAPPNYLDELAAYAAAEDVVVCADECYVDVYAGEAPRSLLELGRKNVLAFFSCSKRSGMTGYRTGFVAGDADLIRILTRFRPNVGVASPEFVERAAVAAWCDDAHARARRERFARKRALFVDFFREAGVEVSGGDATFFLWWRAPGGDDVAYAERLLAEGIVVMPGSWFGPGGEGFCRVALVPDEATCRAAIARWPR